MVYNKEYEHKRYLKDKQKWKDDYRRRPWITHYKSAYSRCNIKYHRAYKYYGGKGIRFLLTPRHVERLWKRDKAKEMKKPSIDRIDRNGDYCFENCRFIELFLNNSLAHRGNEYCKGRKMSEETKQKIREARFRYLRAKET